MDHSGKLDLEEIMMGLGKFNQTKDVEITLDDTVRAIRSFDDNGDAKLDRAEFRHMLSLFAVKTKIPLHELIDFMVVTSALKDNDDGLMAYIASVKARATDQVRRDQSQKRGLKSKEFSIANFWR
jgi:Ca2+-binding EF-hand superfamily protein